MKSTQGIYNAGDAEAVNIRGGDILLEASGGAIGTDTNPLTIQQRTDSLLGLPSILNARSGESIYLRGVRGTYGDGADAYNYSGALALNFIYTPGSVSLESDSVILDARNDGQENIVAASLSIEAASVGQSTNYLDLDLAEPPEGPGGNLNIAANEDIYLREINGNMHVGLVKAENGAIFLKADGSDEYISLNCFSQKGQGPEPGPTAQSGNPPDGEVSIEAVNINLTALNGAIARAGENLLLDTKAFREADSERSRRYLY